jgi:hypothetical protein
MKETTMADPNNNDKSQAELELPAQDGGADVTRHAGVARATAADQDATPAAPVRQSYVDWARAAQIPDWKADAARHGRGWAVGQEVTEVEFFKALDEAFNSRIG